MSIGRVLILGLTVAGTLVMAGAQTSSGQDPAAGTTQTPPAQSAGATSAQPVRTVPAAALSAVVGIQGDAAPEDTNRDLPQIPPVLGGRGMSLAFIPEMERSNYLRGGVNVGAAYDDNPLMAPSGEGNTSGSVYPNISIEETTSRTRWTLGYSGGLTVNQRFTSQNQGSHDFSFDSQFRLSPHVNLRVAENFLLTAGVFDTGNGGGVAGGAGAPNGSVLAPLATQRSSVTTVETNYHFALNDLVGASGSFYDLHFSNSGGQAVLSNTQTASATAFWLHRVFRGDWGGLSYRFQRISFDPDSETRVHSFLVVDTLRLSTHLSLSGFVGPEYGDNRGLVPGAAQASQSSEWSVAGGVEGGWQNERTSLTAGYSRSTSDGGGVLGAVKLQSVQASFRRELVPGWAVSVSASRGTNHSITVPFAGSATSANLTSAGIGLERNVGKGLGLRLSYTHDFQQQFGVTGGSGTPETLDAHRNRFAATLSYQWTKPLGM